MKQRKGRPAKYLKILNALHPHKLYTPASLARFADEQGLIESYIAEGIDKKKALLRIRVAMRKMSSAYFPDEGDGIVFIKGQRPTPGWFGWRWQEPFEKRQKRKRPGPKGRDPAS